MSEGRKQTEDCSKEVEERLPQIINPPKQNLNLLSGALEELLSLEKKTRLAADTNSTKTVAIAVLDLLVACNAWNLLIENISVLSKRRAQLRQVTQAIVQHSVGLLEKVPSEELKQKMIVVLREVSDGKIFVELERARLTQTLSNMQEAKGDIQAAAETLQELQIETVGSMDKKEKAHFLLEQIRLLLAINDFVRAEIITNKVNRKVLLEDDFQELKLKFYHLMVAFHMHKRNYFEICQSYLSIFNTPSVKENIAQWRSALLNATIFLILSPFSPEQHDLMLRMQKEPHLDEVPSAKEAIDLFLKDQLMPCPILQEAHWIKELAFTADYKEKSREDLEKRINEHNIRVIAKFFTKIESKRMSELLRLEESQTEKYISEMVSEFNLKAKIDRAEGVVNFSSNGEESSNALLNNWANDISKLLDLVEKTTHLINKEKMVHSL